MVDLVVSDRDEAVVGKRLFHPTIVVIIVKSSGTSPRIHELCEVTVRVPVKAGNPSVGRGHPHDFSGRSICVTRRFFGPVGGRGNLAGS